MPPPRKKPDLLTHPRPLHERARHRRAFYYSTVFHSLLLCFILGLAWYLDHHHILKNGSAPGAPTVTLTTLTVLSTAPQTAPAKTPDKPAPPTPPTPVAVAPSPETPEESQPDIQPAPPEATVPVLALHETPTPPAPPAKKASPSHHTPSHVAPPAAKVSPTIAEAAPSSYSPGPSNLPHPPYPPEARDHHQTGTVVMSVQFNSQGDVVEVVVTQSSGVPILDSNTRSFARAHWHYPPLAGQLVSVPVRYTLEKL